MATLVGQWWFPFIVFVPFAAIWLIMWVLLKVESPTRAILNVLVVGIAALAARFILHWSWTHVGDVALVVCAVWAAFWLFERWENELVERAAQRAVELQAELNRAKIGAP
ncbi:MAG TPA: hypothetical protein VNV41_07495 [Candidatus Acidoferrales bacterium]|nr:hypothetical protein [Candidatus Acidoferrales bacterium]